MMCNPSQGYYQTQKQKIFVFGSNLAGRHGAGSAKEAVKNHGAIYGQGVGLQGNSYAIPTKDWKIKTMALVDIKIYVIGFIEFSLRHPEMEFHVVEIGCGLAGYTPEQIAPLFRCAIGVDNVILPESFKRVLDK
jgi:hypothetical protein